MASAALPPHYPGIDDPFPWHPFASLFPMIEGAELEKLIESIELNGQAVPGQIYKGQLLDGRNRYAAIEEINLRRRGSGEPYVRFLYEELLRFDDHMALRHVVNHNLTRRHLNPGQYAALVVRIQEEVAKLALVKSQGPAEAPTNEELIQKTGVGHQSLSRAKEVKRHDEDLFEKVERGETSLNSAYNQVRAKKKEALEQAPKQVPLIEEPETPAPPLEPVNDDDHLTDYLLAFVSNLNRFTENEIDFVLCRINEERNACMKEWLRVNSALV